MSVPQGRSSLPPDLSKRRVISEEQAAAYSGVSKATLRRWRRAGTGPRAIPLGVRRIGYRVDALDAWIDARGVEEAA